MNKIERLKFLFQKHVNNHGLSAEEKAELHHLISDASLKEKIDELMNDLWESTSSDINPSQNQKLQEIYQRILFESPEKPVRNPIQWVKIAAAVLLIFSVSFVAYYYLISADRSINTGPADHTVIADIEPGDNKAYLVLEDGRRINLSDLSAGEIEMENMGIATRLAEGQLFYENDTDTDIDNIHYHTIEIPRGGQYTVTLSDGTRVWLNSDTKISFPLKFHGHERRVKIDGEAYFEVAKNAVMPFIVEVDGKQTVQVLGTHFNIQAYTDETAVITTLVEGSVKISRANESKTLKPGQQSHLKTATPDAAFRIVEVDVNEAIAWKNGQFIFYHENIKNMMQRLSRWYDFDVVFEGNLDNINYLGNYDREKSLSHLLKSIETLGKVKFKIEETNITGQLKRRVTVIAN